MDLSRQGILSFDSYGSRGFNAFTSLTNNLGVLNSAFVADGQQPLKLSEAQLRTALDAAYTDPLAMHQLAMDMLKERKSPLAVTLASELDRRQQVFDTKIATDL